jgi:glycosyltransferase involved in cell wall biosynthesis
VEIGRDGDVAVVIPAFNGGEFVEAAIDSVLQQTSPPAEIIVVDDGSTDDTPERVSEVSRSYPRVRLLRQPNQGVSAARNAGVRSTSAPLVAFLDCDDVWYPQKLASQVGYLRDHPQCVVVGSRLHYYGRNGRVRGAVGEPTTAARQSDIRSGRYMPLPLSSWLVRRGAFDSAGGFDEQLQSIGQVEDVDLLARLALLGEVQIFPGAALGGYRLHSGSASSASFFDSREAVRFVRARIEARSAGTELTIERFNAERASVQPSRSDRAQFAFREFGVELAQGHAMRALNQLSRALVLDPGYAVRRVWQRALAGR